MFFFWSSDPFYFCSPNFVGPGSRKRKSSIPYKCSNPQAYINDEVTFRDKTSLLSYVADNIDTVIASEPVRNAIIAQLPKIIETTVIPMYNSLNGRNKIRDVMKELPSDMFALLSEEKLVESVALYRNSRNFIGNLVRNLDIDLLSFNEETREVRTIYNVKKGEIVGVQGGKLTLATEFYKKMPHELIEKKYLRDVKYLLEQCVFDSSSLGFSKFNEILRATRLDKPNLKIRVTDDAAMVDEISRDPKGNDGCSLVFYASKDIAANTIVIT